MQTTPKRIVVKVGSNVLTRPDGKPNITNMSMLVDQIAELRKAGHELILVSSGAVACGRGAFTPTRQLDAVAKRQLFSSIGQVHLINLYESLFRQYGETVGQVLTQKENFASRTAYLNQRSCMQTMLECGVIPIVNENDTASLTELMFTDNDELSGLIASMMDADMLVILSNVDGIFTGDPSLPDSRLISVVRQGDNLSENIVTSKSGFGRGGMGTKYATAEKVAREGIAVCIARGSRPGVLTAIINNPSSTPHTLFEPAANPVSGVKRWIAHSDSFAKGIITVNSGACDILLSDKPVSLLPIGVISTEGDWAEGDIVRLAAPDGSEIGAGKASMSSADTRRCIGQRDSRPIIHYDYLFII